MNYFCHGERFLDDPYFVAGTAVPDWLNVVDRKIRVRRPAAGPFAHDPDAATARVARGILQHHEDDDWFHRTRAFVELSLEFTVAVRGALAGDDGMRVHFLGHILVELLLDAELIDRRPEHLQRYYEALAEADPVLIAQTVGRISGRDAKGLAYLIPRFIAERFLWDYADDAKLLWRLNQVMRRVRLPALPDQVLGILPAARQSVPARQAELLAPPSDEPKVADVG